MDELASRATNGPGASKLAWRQTAAVPGPVVASGSLSAMRASQRLGRLVVTLLAAGTILLAATDAARGADRTDPIPSTVGPPGGVGFYVNPSAPGWNATRVQEIIRRSLARWGDTYLGTTTNAPGVADGQNVIGVATLPAGTLGLSQSRSTQTTTSIAATRTCVASAREPSDTVVRRNRSRTVRLRRDRVVAGHVRRTSVSRKLRVPSYQRVRKPAITQLCTLGDATTAVTPTPEFDVALNQSAGGSNEWTLGPAFPTGNQFDFETNVLHELGHVSGLAHELDRCDPSTPMPASQGAAEYWHGVDEWSRPGCGAPAPPAPITGVDSEEPLPGAGASTLAGQSILINPTVPAGYDSARFVSVAGRAIRRAGGTPAGVSNIAPSNGDGNSVLGFAPLGAGTLSSSSRTPRRQIMRSYKVQTCRRARVRVRKPAVIRKFVRVGRLRLRRDVITTRARNVSGFRCTTRRRAGRTSTLPPELDLRINDRTIAWEFGPRFPVDGTRWDLETAILQNVIGAGGAPPGAPCDTATPDGLGAAPGDWWRSSAEVRRSRCLAGGSPNVKETRTLRGTAGKEIVLRASGR
ncbi:MAG: hypothetical protein QOF69_1017 [Solirubrobacteraceae bacterium]|nr:hypothetical protein [Solirubrobacteraceae bacterium]